MSNLNWHEHWKNEILPTQTLISPLTDAKYIIEANDGKKVQIETVCVKRSPCGNPRNNIVTVRYTGSKTEFNYREEEIHKRIIAWR